MYSVFTNNVEEPILDETTFIPETNVFMLYISIFKVVEVTRSSMQKQFMRTIDTTIELLAGVGDINIGVILETSTFSISLFVFNALIINAPRSVLPSCLGWTE